MNTKGEKPITENEVTTWQDLRHQAAVSESGIVNRLDYIVHRCFYEFEGILAEWYFNGAVKGEVGDLGQNLGRTTISGIIFEAETDPSQEMIILLKDGSEFELDAELPISWLYEDFETELIEGKKAYEEKIARKKAATKTNKTKRDAKKAAAIESAKTKLTEEEKKALGLA